MPHKKKKLRIGVIFGGRSAEHEVSLVSATSVMNALDRNKYEIIPIGITPSGKWISSGESMKLLKEGNLPSRLPEKIILPDPEHHGLVPIRVDSRSNGPQGIDAIFPVLHGTFGEDGTVQGLFELAGIPYVGAGVLGSAIGMDKVVAKQICETVGIPVSPYIYFTDIEYKRNRKKLTEAMERKLKYPMFVKPANSGSSVGISKVHRRNELHTAIDLAIEYDRKILVERSIENSREIEMSVLGNDDPHASVPGEIISSNEFYDYDAKYVDGKSSAVIPAKLPRAVTRRLQEYAVRSFKILNCSGMARIDFLVIKKSMKIFFNEINTIPGFTSISMYPKLWEASGIPYSKLLDRLIQLAIERFQKTKKLKTMYTPKTDWYKG
jgi:D-alanine-D-alanine ligase